MKNESDPNSSGPACVRDLSSFSSPDEANAAFRQVRMEEQWRQRIRAFVPKPMIEARRTVIKGVRRARAEWPLVALQLGRLGTLEYRRRGALAKRLLDVHTHVQCA